jgi:hypothetical protein
MVQFLMLYVRTLKINWLFFYCRIWNNYIDLVTCPKNTVIETRVSNETISLSNAKFIGF